MISTQPSTLSPLAPKSTTTSNGSQVGSEPALSMNDFLKLLTVQLSTQNPLEPMNDRDFFAQMAQLGTVSGIDKLRESLESTQASALIGKKVTANTPDGEVSGIARYVSFQNGAYKIGIDTGNGVLEAKLSDLARIEAS